MRTILKILGSIADIHDAYAWAMWVWGGIAGVVILMIAVVTGLPLAAKVTLSLVAFAAALNIWFILAWAPSKTTWGRKAKRRARLNAYLKMGNTAFIHAKNSPDSQTLWGIAAKEYEPWAIEVREYLRAEYDDVIADRWIEVGANFQRTIYWGSKSEDDKLTEMNILYKKLENILRREDGDPPREIPELTVGPQLGTSLSSNAGSVRMVGSTGPTRDGDTG